jgi:chemotaxis protein methyltransferase CheR
VLTARVKADFPSTLSLSAAVNVPDSISQLEALEIELLVEAVFRRYGYDFREYAAASLRRRLKTFLRSEGLTTVSGLQGKVLHDPACLERLLPALLVNVTSLFRDPDFFLAFRNKVAPLLRTYPFVRIWHAGCSTGEEV